MYNTTIFLEGLQLCLMGISLGCASIAVLSHYLSED